MRIKEINTKGSYAGLRVAAQSCADIRNYVDENHIPQTPSDKEQRLHVTLLYSKKYLPDFEPAGPVRYDCKPAGFDVFPSQEGGRCLVLLLDSEQLVQRHKTLMKKHKATFDYDKYIPHVTFSYDIGDFDITKLPPFTRTIVLDEEYGEELDIDWLKTETLVQNKSGEVITEDDMFEMSNLRKDHTGLPVNIYVSSGGSVNKRHGPRIKVMVNSSDKMNIHQTVSVLLKPNLTAEDVVGYQQLSPELILALRLFVNKNYKTLLAYWNDEIDTAEMIKKVKSL